MTKALALACALSSGCLTFSDFDLPRSIPEQKLDGSAMPVPLQQAFPLGLDLDLSSYLDKYKGRAAEVNLTSLALTVTATQRPAGDTDDFAFIDELHVFVAAEKLPRVEIAHAKRPGAKPTIAFVVDASVDLAPYVHVISTVDAAATGTVPSDTISFDGRAVFAIHPL